MGSFMCRTCLTCCIKCRRDTNRQISRNCDISLAGCCDTSDFNAVTFNDCPIHRECGS